MLATRPVTREELVRRASALVPRLRERAAETERLRRLTDETVDDLVNAGLLRIGNPDRFGGVGLDLDASFEVVMELGRGCGSTAWVYSVLNTHNWMVGHWPEQAQEEFFADSPDTFASSGFEPGRAQVEIVSGGYRLSGRWSFSSGCDAARWVMVGGLVLGRHVLFLVPMAEVTVIDTWFVSGLRGTGSKDLVVDGAFVPSHRACEMRALREAHTDGWTIHRRAGYRAPQATLMPGTLVSPIVGMALGAVEAFTDGLQGRKRPDGTPLTHTAASQLRLAESSAEADAARCLLLHNTREAIERAGRGEAFTMLDRVRARRDQLFAVKLAVRAIGRLVEEGGAHALHESSPLQRFYRDALAASQHHQNRWDDNAEQYGRVALGLDPAANARL